MSTLACHFAELKSTPCYSLQHLQTTSNTLSEQSNGGSLVPTSFGTCHFKSSSGVSLHSVQQRTHWRQTTASTPWTGRWQRRSFSGGASGRRTPVENVQVVRERANLNLLSSSARAVNIDEKLGGCSFYELSGEFLFPFAVDYYFTIWSFRAVSLNRA